MATVIASTDTPESFCSNKHSRDITKHHFDPGRFYMLVVVGEVTSSQQLKCAIEDIEKGLRTLLGIYDVIDSASLRLTTRGHVTCLAFCKFMHIRVL